jgi:phage terminase Nu1 subunit (DNA packaging protein)
MSLTAYAKRRGVSAMAVSNAVKTGRLVASVARVKGQPKIRDAVLADREWDANTDLSKAPGYVKQRGADRPRGPGRPPKQDDDDQVRLGMSLADASAAEKVWKARIAELDFLERSSALVDAKEMTAKLVDVYTRCRTKLLGIPTRVKQQLPELSIRDVAAVDGLVRETLEELAEELSAEDVEAQGVDVG